MSFVQPFRAYIDGLVNSFAAPDPMTASRQRALVVLCMLGALAALMLLSLYLAIRGATSALEVSVFACFAVPILIASFVLRTGGDEDVLIRLLTQNMADVMTRHGRNGAVLFVSPAAQALFGVPIPDLLDRGLCERVHSADRPAYLSALADAARGEPRSAEFRVMRPLAASSNAVEFVWVEMRCCPVDQNPANANCREVVAVMRDVSDRKVQEQALHTARAESERANQAKTRFLATMSHELRTPLNAVIGFSEMLVNEEPMRLDAVRRRHYAQLINDSGNHLLAIINGILDMSKIETGDFEITPEPFAPAAAIRNCCDLLALKAFDGEIELVIRNADNLPDIIADKRAFKQIMLNLVSNAIKFSDRGGQITVTSRLDGGRFAVSVEDNGIGIGSADLAQIGSPFFQARSAYDRRHDGTGLGLSIVKGLVSLHGGELQMRSELGQGTSMSVYLPLDCETASRSLKCNSALPSLPMIRQHNEPAVRKSA